MASSAQSRPEPPPAMGEYQRLARSAFDGGRARDFVAFMDQYVRLPGNEGFDASASTTARIAAARTAVAEAGRKAVEALGRRN